MSDAQIRREAPKDISNGLIKVGPPGAEPPLPLWTAGFSESGDTSQRLKAFLSCSTDTHSLTHTHTHSLSLPLPRTHARLLCSQPKSCPCRPTCPAPSLHPLLTGSTRITVPSNHTVIAPGHEDPVIWPCHSPLQPHPMMWGAQSPCPGQDFHINSTDRAGQGRTSKQPPHYVHLPPIIPLPLFPP